MPSQPPRPSLFALALAAGAVALVVGGDRAWSVRLVDVAADLGLRGVSVYGGVERKRFIIETNGAGAAWLDLDDDGWLDAIVLGGSRLGDAARADDPAIARGAPTTRVYRNVEGRRFQDITGDSGLARTAWASSLCAGDYDGDGALDLYVTAYGENVLYRNAGTRFEDRTAAAGLARGGTRWGSGCSFLDYDRDGDLDLFVGNYLVFDLATAKEPGEGIDCLWKGVPVNCGPKGLPTDTNLLYRNLGNGRFEDVSEASGIARVRNRYPMSVVAADLDEDGWVDLYVASDSTAAIHYRNNQDGTFSDVALSRGTAFSENGTPQSSRGAAFGDFDNDGDVDVLIMNMNAPPSLLRNEQRSGHHWLQVRLEGPAGNRQGLGATVRVTAGGRTQARAVLSQSSYYSLDDLRLSFGLGTARAAERVDVAWPNGERQSVSDVAANQVLTVRFSPTPPSRN
jgi:hypothetical protein